MTTNAELRSVLDRIGDRFRRERLFGGLAVCWVTLAVIGLVAAGQVATGRTLALGMVAVAAVVGGVWWFVSQQMARDPLWIAQQIEAKYPSLSALLLTAIEQKPTADGRFGFIQTAVMEQAVEHSRKHNWDDTVPLRRLRVTRVAHGIALVALVAVVGWLAFHTATATVASVGTVVAPIGVNAETAISVEPGNTEIERGSALVVTARFRGGVPADVLLVTEGTTPALPPRAMARNLEDPTFAGYVGSVTNDMSYRVVFDGRESETFRVKVFEHPELLKVNAKLVFPNYTGLEPKSVDDVRHVTAVEGTTITLRCQLSKAVTKAVFVDDKKAELPLTLADAAMHIYEVSLTPTESKRYRVQLADADGRANKLPADISINVTQNLPPVVKVPQPGRDSRVSPIEELSLKADMRDDFGVIRHGITVTASNLPAKEIALGQVSGKAPLRVQAGHMIDFEALKAEPDQVVSYYFWAEDIGPDGKLRRSSGDMYFAEVRHFEEIFRQGEQQSGEQQERERQEREQGGNTQAAEQLAEMQKQIVNATWKLVRREISITPTDKFADDVKLLIESQQAVIDKAGELSDKLQGESAQHLKKAVDLMEAAKKQLGEASEKGTPGVLPTALGSEQAAYQAMLKLRAREFEVTRSNQRQQQSSRSSSSSRGPSQRQLQQLDLADEQQRYETQNAAREQRERQAQRDREQRENQELADRLKELARRQTDLTDRVKELQSALEQAKDEQKKEELQQQLKKLRDQQQQVLRDTDELQERLEQEQNRDRLAESRQQVEQSREAVRQASEALEKGQLGQAVNEGTRAQRQLENVRDELRKQTANRFGEEMRDLRQQGRKLDDEQQKLTKQLEEMKQNPKPKLNSTEEREQVQKGLEGQKQQLEQLTERIQKVVEDAEKSEPQLAQELFNTVRGAAEQKVGDSLELARRLNAGGLPEAADAARKAAQGTEQIRKGIEKASEAVVGGQTDALKRAQRELNELSEQVNREVAQATGQPQPGQPKDGQGKEPGKGEGKEPGMGQGQAKAPGMGQGKEPGMGQQAGKEPGMGQGKEPGKGEGKEPGQGKEPGMGQGQAGSSPTPRRLGEPSDQPRGNETSQGGGGARGGPIREEGFREWFDRMRATEDLIDDPQLRAEAAQIRERVRAAREEFKRHAKEPNWKQIQDMVAKPLSELHNRVAEEVRRRESPNSLVPIDRDPVPPEFADSVRRYYERLGSGK